MESDARGSPWSAGAEGWRAPVLRDRALAVRHRTGPPPLPRKGVERGQQRRPVASAHLPGQRL
ncbi:hypothetical protein, partial [Streptomyces californicus]|uniref:hypothetical protein n=1 Tax=Streptomyces californicus TaxID=67351 RepID=UPI003410F221